MEQKQQNVIIIALVALIIGLGIGYSSSGMRMGWVGGFGSAQEMHDEMERFHDDPIIQNDGAMQHAMDEMLLVLRGKEGAVYEEAFLRAMVVHHLGAIAMAEDLREHTQRPELVRLADEIVAAQTGEVSMMRGWLSEWYGSN